MFYVKYNSCAQQWFTVTVSIERSNPGPFRVLAPTEGQQPSAEFAGGWSFWTDFRDAKYLQNPMHFAVM